MRLDRFICECSGMTRSEAKKNIKHGLVKVNDLVIKDGGFQVDTASDLVWLNGQRLEYEKFSYYIFYKPQGCVCASKDNIHDTVFSYVPMNGRGDLITVGRLDKDTEGLLLITNDGVFSHNLLSPQKHVDKTYFAIWDKAATSDDVRAFEEGLDIGDEDFTKPAILSYDESNPNHVTITISEGRFHQVKRMSMAVGKEVLYLKRLFMGKFTLDDTLAPGRYRRFTEREMNYVTEYKSGHI